MNIYVSEFEKIKDYEVEKIGDAIEQEFGSEGVNVWRSNAFTSYEDIQTKIAKSDVFVALIDEVWESSTWKMSEYGHAFCSENMILDEDGHSITKKIIYLHDGWRFPSYLASFPGDKVVVRNLDDLLKSIRTCINT